MTEWKCECGAMNRTRMNECRVCGLPRDPGFEKKYQEVLKLYRQAIVDANPPPAPLVDTIVRYDPTRHPCVGCREGRRMIVSFIFGAGCERYTPVLWTDGHGAVRPSRSEPYTKIMRPTHVRLAAVAAVAS